ncbi:MAG: M48 family metalloprotease, partial [Candidatus Chromulinivorax sp.]|nr:M48 family metalloprotease [Candidatus Chromulinivorax sp.]
MKTRIISIILAMLLITMPMPQLLAMTTNTTPTTNQTSKPRTFLEKAWDVLSSPSKQYYQVDQPKTEFGKFMDSLRFSVDDTKIEHNQYINIHNKTYGINLSLYSALQSTEQKTLQNSIIKGKNGTGFQIITQHDDTGDHIFISLDDKTINKLLADDQTTKDLIKTKYNQYHEEKLAAFRPKILSIIQELAPELHAKITMLDKDGSQHIVAGGSLSVLSITQDGLPIIYVPENFFNKSIGSQKAGIAHEIGHYALEHQVIKKTTYNEHNLGDIFNEATSHKKIDKTTTITSNKKLAPRETMTKAYSRTYEYEADRFAMVNMGVSYDDVQAMVKEMDDSTACTTFETTHPLHKDRLKQFQAIASELELVKNSPSIKKPTIDWDEVQYDTLSYSSLYFSVMKSNSVDPLADWKNAVEKYMPHRLPEVEADIANMKQPLTNTAKENNLEESKPLLAQEKPLSIKEWVNIHKFLLPIDSPIIEKLQACEAAGASCIKRGEDGTGVQIVQDPENTDKFVISFDTQMIDQINSRDPQVRAELNKNIQDIFTKHLADNAKSKTAKNNAKRKTNRSLPTRKTTQELTITQPQIESKLTIDKPMFTSPFAIKTKIASPYNNIGNRIKNTPPTAQTPQIQNAIQVHQQNQRARQLAQQHQSEH